MAFWSLSVTVGNLWVLLVNAAVRNDGVTQAIEQSGLGVMSFQMFFFAAFAFARGAGLRPVRGPLPAGGPLPEGGIEPRDCGRRGRRNTQNLAEQYTIGQPLRKSGYRPTVLPAAWDNIPHRLIRVHGRGNPAEVPAMTDHTHSQAKTTATPGAPAIVTGGGHVYPSPRQGLTIFHGHMAATESQKQRDFQAIREGEPTRGGERGYIYKKIVSALS